MRFVLYSPAKKREADRAKKCGIHLKRTICFGGLRKYRTFALEMSPKNIFLATK